MFYAVILGHFIASVFACLGLVNACYCIGAAEREMGGGVFFSQLAAAVWPLAVAAVSEILLLILQQLELINLRAEEQPVAGRAAAASAKEKPASFAPKKETAEKREETPETPAGMVYFPVRETALAPVEGAEEPQAEKKEGAAPEAEKPMEKAHAEPPAEAAEGQKEEESGLQFFKLR